MLCPEFNMHRMVKQYTNEYYLVAHNRFRQLSAEGGAKAMQLAAWLDKVEKAWPQLRIESLGENVPEIELGAHLEVSARVFLGGLEPADVTVETLLGRMSADGEIIDFVAVPMESHHDGDAGRYVFQSVVQPTSQSGMYGYGIRVLPRPPYSLSPFLPGLILWAGDNLPQEAESFSAKSGSGA